MAGSPNVPGTIPFAGASLPYREQFFSTTFTAGTSTQNVSPPGNSIKSYGYARALRVYTTASGGSGGNLAAETVAKAAPDGYTLLMSSVASNAINASYYTSLNYDFRKDFAPVTKFGSIPNGLFVGPELPANNLKDLTALLKAAPGKYSCASSGTGGLLHLTCEMYKKAAGLDVLHVPYKGATYQPDLIAGRVTLVFDNIPVYVPLVKSGRLKVLAITSATRSPVLPFVPTAIEQGVPGYDISQWIGFVAPGATPAAIVNKFNAEVNRIMQLADVRERLDALSLEFTPNTPAQFSAAIKEEIPRYAVMVKQSGAKAD